MLDTRSSATKTMDLRYFRIQEYHDDKENKENAVKIYGNHRRIL